MNERKQSKAPNRQDRIDKIKRVAAFGDTVAGPVSGATTVTAGCNDDLAEDTKVDEAVQEGSNRYQGSRAIVAREDGQFGRPLFQGSEGHDTPEASTEDLLFLIIKDVARTKGGPQPTREEFDARVQANWQGLQGQSRREAGGIAWLEYQVRVQYGQGS